MKQAVIALILVALVCSIQSVRFGQNFFKNESRYNRFHVFNLRNITYSIHLSLTFLQTNNEIDLSNFLFTWSEPNFCRLYSQGESVPTGSGSGDNFALMSYSCSSGSASQLVYYPADFSTLVTLMYSLKDHVDSEAEVPNSP